MDYVSKPLNRMRNYVVLMDEFRSLRMLWLVGNLGIKHLNISIE